MRMPTSRFFSLVVGVVAAGVLTASGGLAQGQSPAGMEKDNAFPANAKAGECYARVSIPPKYKTETVKVLKSEATERIETAPAKYEWVNEQVIVQEPSERIEVIPATYAWVEEQVVVRPASTHTEVVQAVYATVTERVLDQPAHTEWKKGRGPLERIDHATGEIMCLVEVPATYRTVRKRVLKQPAATRAVQIPADYKTLRKRVMSTPPSTRVIKLPAKFKTVRVRKLVSPAMTKSVPVSAEYQWISKRVKVSEAEIAWRTVLCETNTTPDAVSSIQGALQKAGYDPGKIDGVIGSKTRQALKAYQTDKGLPLGGLTIDTLKSLGVDVNRS